MHDRSEDFQDFLEENRQYWDYVDEGLEQAFKGVSPALPAPSNRRRNCGEATLARIMAAFPQAHSDYTEDKDWENDWRNYYEPIEVGKRIVVVPEWMDAPSDGRVPLRLDPGIAFGTGSHPTTKLCLAALEDFITPDTRVLDLGCGSGILGIGALLLGAAHCTGCDIDPLAGEAAAANRRAERHRLRQAEGTYTGDIIRTPRCGAASAAAGTGWCWPTSWQM